MLTCSTDFTDGQYIAIIDFALIAPLRVDKVRRVTLFIEQKESTTNQAIQVSEAKAGESEILK